MSHIHSLLSLCLRLFPLCCGSLLTAPLAAQVPNLIPHQGRVAVNGVNFDGTGQFKFALVNAAGTTTYWSNNGTSVSGSQPTAAVSLLVTKGLYSALLGDTSLTNMTAVPASVYANADLRLRVWFNNGTLGFQQLTPDQRLAPNGYLPDGAITSEKLAPGATPTAVQVTGASQNVVPNTNYLATGSGTTTFNLPTTAAIGDVVTIGSGGAAGVAVTNPYGWTARGETRGWLSVASSADGTKLVATGTNPYTNGGQLFTSSDSGQTWVARAPILAWKVASSADGSRLIAAGLDGQLWLSSDSGVTWNTREQNRDWRSVAMSADGSKIIAAHYQGQLYTSVNYGATWTPREQNRYWTAVASSADGTKLIAGINGGNLYISADSGVTWIPREQIWSWRDVASSADGTRLIAAGGSRLVTSADAGVNWAAREEDMNWIAVASSADGMKLAAAEAYDRIHVSTDAGATWSPREGSRQWVSLASSADGSKLLAAVQGGRLFISGAVLNTAGAETAAFTFSSEGWRLTAPAGQWTPHGGDIYRSSGNIGIGTATPNFPLSFGTGTANTLLALYDEGLNWSYGLGIGDRQFRLHLGKDFSTAGARFSFLDAPVGNELMTIRSTGRVGIGEANPVSALHVNGVITGNGSGLTNLSAAQLTGSVPTASLTSLPAAGLTGSVPAASLTSVPSASLTGSLPLATLPSDIARRAGGNALTGTQSIANGRLGVGTTNPAALLQVGDKNVSNSLGMIRLASTSPSSAAWREWEIGVPGGTEDVTGKNYSFIIDDLLGGNGQPEVIVRYDTGHVGIGTADPAARLDVDTGGAGRVQIRNEGNFVPAINVTGGPLPGYLRFRNAFEIWPNDAGTAPGRMDIRNTTGAPTITMDGGPGRICIGRTAAVNRLEVEGDASKAVAGAWLANSDRRIKTDITPVTGALATLEKVRPVTFRYTDEYRKTHPDIKDVPYYNVIAQEFREVFPGAVKSSGEKLPDGFEILQVDTYPATITALAAIKELKAENDALKAANMAMEQRLAAIEEMMRRTQPVKLNPNHQEVTP